MQEREQNYPKYNCLLPYTKRTYVFTSKTRWENFIYDAIINFDRTLIKDAYRDIDTETRWDKKWQPYNHNMTNQTL